MGTDLEQEEFNFIVFIITIISILFLLVVTSYHSNLEKENTEEPSAVVLIKTKVHSKTIEENNDGSKQFTINFYSTNKSEVESVYVPETLYNSLEIGDSVVYKINGNGFSIHKTGVK